MTGDVDVDRFVAYLRAFAVGACHAQPAVTICVALGLEPSERQRRVLRAWSALALQAGHLVCAGQRGYYLPASPEEVLATTRRLRNEATQLRKRAQKAEELAVARFGRPEGAGLPPTPRPALFAILEAPVALPMAGEMA